VATEAVKMHAMIDPKELKCPVEVMQMVAWLHDSLEDQVDETALREELETIFPQETQMVEMIVEGVKFLTKPDWREFGDDAEKKICKIISKYPEPKKLLKESQLKKILERD
jgi:hypothetical protein